MAFKPQDYEGMFGGSFGMEPDPEPRFPALGPPAPPSPTYPQPGIIQAPTQDKEQGAMAAFAQAFQQILPLLLAAGAYKQGALGSFTGGYLGAEGEKERLALGREDRDLRRGDYERRGREEERAIAEAEYQRELREREAARREATEKQQAEEKLRALVEKALRPFEENPVYADGIPAEVADGAMVQIPGLPQRVSLRAALEFVGYVEDQEGMLRYGKRAAPERPPLITGEGGERIIDEPGARPLQPREPREPRIPNITLEDGTRGPDVPGARPLRPESSGTTRSYNVTDPVTQEQWRIVEDAQGNEISRRKIVLDEDESGGENEFDFVPGRGLVPRRPN